ncbi:hypothetical protein MTO96_022072 [Rhipicephalus appendiculatus]
MRTTSVIVLLAGFIAVTAVATPLSTDHHRIPHGGHGNHHEAAVIPTPVLPGHHATHHHGPHYEGGAYGCPLFGVICKLRCDRAGHGKGYCDGPHRGRCMCPHW